jgi:hypothetical protein
MIGRFWDWPNKPVKERVVARQILLDAKFEVAAFGSRQDDPPDCEGLLDGQWSAVEVTQLMHVKARAQSMKAIKQQPEQPERYYLWDRDDALRAIQELIEVKDAKRYQGGPYQRFVLVIYTDEFVLSDATMHQLLDGATLRTRVFTDVVVGLSYERGFRHVPYLSPEPRPQKLLNSLDFFVIAARRIAANVAKLPAPKALRSDR